MGAVKDLQLRKEENDIQPGDIVLSYRLKDNLSFHVVQDVKNDNGNLYIRLNGYQKAMFNAEDFEIYRCLGEPNYARMKHSLLKRRDVI